MPGVKPQMEEPAENTDAQTSNAESPEMEERAEMEKTTDMEEASMVVAPWRRHRGVSTGSGSTSRGGHEELEDKATSEDWKNQTNDSCG